MSNNNHPKKKKRMNARTRTFITGAVFILAILVIILCIMSGALTFKKGSAKETPTPTPSVTAPPSTPQPSASEPVASDKPSEPVTFSVTVFSGHGGSTDPQGTTTVRSGDSITIHFIPDEGYRVSTVTVNGELTDPSDSYTIDSVTEDMSIDVGFDLDTPAATDDPGAEVLPTG
jgi:hypothetical protein